MILRLFANNCALLFIFRYVCPVKRTLLVGTGPSVYAVLNSLERLNDIWIMDGQTDFNFNAISTRSHLALKQKFGSSHTYVDSQSLGLKGNRSFQLPISYSRGGFGEIWGNGFTPYDIFELMPEDKDELYSPLLDAMKELLDLIPFSHAESELDYRFGKLENWSNSKTYSGINLHPLFANFLSYRKKLEPDNLLFGQPNLLLDPEKCTRCGLCLTGCPYGALFDPGEYVTKMIYSGRFSSDRFIRGILKRIDLVETGVVVTYSVDGTEISQNFDEVILAAGPLSTALILINSGLLPDNFFIPDSQVFYGAFLSLRRFRPKKELQEVGQLVCYPLKKSEGDFQITLYSPSDTSRMRISKMILPSFLQFLKLPKIFSDRIIPAIGFLPQSESGGIQITKSNSGIEITRPINSESKVGSKRSLKKVASATWRSGFIHIPFSTQVPVPGSGFHIGASLPLGGKHVDAHGYLVNSKSVRVLDASILPRIPAGGHTFLTMALIRALVRGKK